MVKGRQNYPRGTTRGHVSLQKYGFCLGAYGRQENESETKIPAISLAHSACPYKKFGLISLF